MFPKGTACLLLALGLTGCRLPVPSLPAPGTLRAALPGPPGNRWLMVTGSEQEGAQWFALEGVLPRPLPSPPVALFPHELSVSPDGRYLAVVSAGEGHPVLDVLILERVLDGTHGEHPFWTLDPYPGSVELVGWNGARLKVRSDRPLEAGRDGTGRPLGEAGTGPWQAFILDPATGCFLKE